LIFSSLDIVSKTADDPQIGLVLLPCQQQKSLRHLVHLEKLISQGTLNCIEVGIFYISVAKRGSLLLFFAQVWLIFNFCL